MGIIQHREVNAAVLGVVCVEVKSKVEKKKKKRVCFSSEVEGHMLGVEMGFKAESPSVKLKLLPAVCEHNNVYIRATISGGKCYYWIYST